MNKTLKWSLIGVGSLLVLVFAAFFLMKGWTKSYSPEETLVFQSDSLKIEVFYNRPYKKSRKVFGELVPYNKVWRTGANEATTFETNRDILVDGSLLKAGKYSVWTVPKKESWEIIFNSKMYSWGVKTDGSPSRESRFDVLKIEVPVLKNYKTIEQFTIYFESGNPLNHLFFAWENVVVAVPFRNSVQ
ncbi:MAG TPA: DUF2911 domain-containing protein [Flavobacteriaceae bacterium]|nr:DUF2911 domain-containing protein [Flavobacteriaceae bacterium]